MNNLEDNWTLYIHYSNDTNWDESSYKKVIEFSTVEELLCVYSLIKPDLYNNCMFFLMRNNIKPLWEDPQNENGGAFSFKVPMQTVDTIWKYLCYQCIGETLFNDECPEKCINGVTLSPKKNFGILKIWTKDCVIQDSSQINLFDGLTKEGCMFRKHIS
tara:strand:+ start:14762 stop:15238 length:477 start_codon:yes stop_codon:yes gene_type:complete